MNKVRWPGQLVVRVRFSAQEAIGTVRFSNDACFLWPAETFAEGRGTKYNFANRDVPKYNLGTRSYPSSIIS